MPGLHPGFVAPDVLASLDVDLRGDAMNLADLVAIASLLMPGVDVLASALASFDDTDYSLRESTKAMAGNARRRALMAQVRERTRRRFDGDEWWRSDEPFDGNFEP